MWLNNPGTLTVTMKRYKMSSAVSKLNTLYAQLQLLRIGQHDYWEHYRKLWSRLRMRLVATRRCGDDSVVLDLTDSAREAVTLRKAPAAAAAAQMHAVSDSTL